MEKLLQSYQKGNNFGYIMLDTDNEKETPNTTLSTNTALHRAVEIIFTQMSAKKGISRFVEISVAAIIKAYKQLDREESTGKLVVQPIEQNNLTKEEWSKALEAVNLIKEKETAS